MSSILNGWVGPAPRVKRWYCWRERDTEEETVWRYGNVGWWRIRAAEVNPAFWCLVYFVSPMGNCLQITSAQRIPDLSSVEPWRYEVQSSLDISTSLSWTRVLPRLTQIRGPAQTNIICALLYYRFLQGYVTTKSIAIGWFLLSCPEPGWLLQTGRFDLGSNFMCVPSWLPRLSFNRPRYKKEVCYLTTPGCFLLTCMLILTWRLHSRI